MSEYFDESIDIERERQANQHRDVAVVGLRNPQGELLLVRTVRFPTRWQPVGGGVGPEDQGSLVATLVREVNEEIGVSLRPSDFVHVVEAPYDFGTGSVHFFIAQLPDSHAELQVDESQIVEIGWFDLEAALSLPVFPATATFLAELVRL